MQAMAGGKTKLIEGPRFPSNLGITCEGSGPRRGGLKKLIDNHSNGACGHHPKRRGESFATIEQGEEPNDAIPEHPVTESANYRKEVGDPSPATGSVKK